MSALRNRPAGLGRRAKVLLAIVCVVLILGVAGALALSPSLATGLTRVLPGLAWTWCDPEADSLCAGLAGQAYEECMCEYCQR